VRLGTFFAPIAQWSCYRKRQRVENRVESSTRCLDELRVRDDVQLLGGNAGERGIGHLFRWKPAPDHPARTSAPAFASRAAMPLSEAGKGSASWNISSTDTRMLSACYMAAAERVMLRYSPAVAPHTTCMERPMAHVMRIEPATDTTAFDVLLASVTTQVEQARFVNSRDARKAVVLAIVQDVAAYVLSWDEGGRQV
jgi:hypothetical protein